VSDAAARVLEALREGEGPRSGEALSERLGVSRAQIWKHIEGLRRRGYEIAGEPGGGYRLRRVPDRLYPEEIAARLETRWLARQIEHLDRTDSTNRIAAERAQTGAAHGYTVVSEAQTAGRGRLGRSFFSPPYLNLYSSSVLRPSLDTMAAPTLIPTAAIAVADAVAAELGTSDAVEIKWPNDVLIDGLKTSGILMEMQTVATQVGHVVLGIGVNLNVEPADFPDEFRSTATSVGAHAGRPIDRVAFATRLYRLLEDALDEHARGGFALLRPRYEAHFRMPGREVRVVGMDGSETVGRAAGIDDDGALLIDRADAERTRVIAGDVMMAREAR
jgi:BirA family biotin operon repressor/biotin-[acetyl-CoA-carboxylase] ligase